MAYLMASLMMMCSTILIKSYPINNGFSVKFNPIAVNEEFRLKSFGAFFAKIPQDLNARAKLRREVISKTYYQNGPELGTGCTNQVVKVVTPPKNTNGRENNENETESKVQDVTNFINLPILKQPYDDYKILVATAPPNIKINNNDKNNPLLIYVIFTEEDSEDANATNLPAIYFVKKRKGEHEVNEVSRKEKADPIFIVDSNRTVTGLKSKEIEKFVTFRNKLTGRYKYEVLR